MFCGCCFLVCFCFFCLFLGGGGGGSNECSLKTIIIHKRVVDNNGVCEIEMRTISNSMTFSRTPLKHNTFPWLFRPLKVAYKIPRLFQDCSIPLSDFLTYSQFPELQNALLQTCWVGLKTNDTCRHDWNFPHHCYELMTKITHILVCLHQRFIHTSPNYYYYTNTTWTINK